MNIDCFQLMMLVDYGGAIIPIIAYSPWNGLPLADSVMPFFLFIAGVSLALDMYLLHYKHAFLFLVVVTLIRCKNVRLSSTHMTIMAFAWFFNKLLVSLCKLCSMFLNLCWLSFKPENSCWIRGCCFMWDLAFMSSKERSKLSQELLLALVSLTFEIEFRSI